jgi:hypothetical protein
MRRTLVQIVGLGAIAVVATGCTGPIAIALAGASVASYAATGKSLSGHAVHSMTGRDCEMMNLLVAKPLCTREQAAVEVADSEPLYCYHTLGQVTCHRVPDPWMSPLSRVQ